MTAVRALHRCDGLCSCPVHGTALYFAPASNEHACQNPTCRYAHGISTDALPAAILGLPMTEDTSVFGRFVAARRADPDCLQVPAQPIAETLRDALLENRPAAAVPDAGGDPTKGRWKPGSATVKKENLDRAQSRAENPWHKVSEKQRAAEQQ